MISTKETLSRRIQAIFNRLSIGGGGALVDVELLDALAIVRLDVSDALDSTEPKFVSMVTLDAVQTIWSYLQDRGRWNVREALLTALDVLSYLSDVDESTHFSTLFPRPSSADANGSITEYLNVLVGILEEGCDDADVVLKLCDVFATLSLHRSHVRQILGGLPTLPSLLVTLTKQHKTHNEILFAVTCLCSTLVLNDLLNTERLAQVGMMRILLEIFKFSSRKLQVIRTALDGTVQEELHRLQTWSRLALMNIVTCALSHAEEEDAVARTRAHNVLQYVTQLDFGKAGDVVAVDDLQWDIKAKCSASQRRIPLGKSNTKSKSESTSSEAS